MNVHPATRLFLALFTISASIFSFANEELLEVPLPRESNWKYEASGTDLGTSWRETGFNDNGWSSGDAILGFGESYITTTLPSGNPTYYFRKEFTLADNPATIGQLLLLANYDDGFVIYINGQEAARPSMPGGTITYNTLASSLHEGGGYEQIDLSAHIDKLVAGNNLVAVEVHQRNLSSSDLVMDMELRYGVGTPPVTVLARLSNWKYEDSGTDLGASWRNNGFDDGNWPSGDAILGFGESYITTTLSSGNPTYYFRREFTLNDAPSAIGSLKLFANYDDSFVAYLNGQEVARQNLPGGNINYNTLASGNHEGGAYEEINLTNHIAELMQGTNLFAIEVHQISTSSSDVVMDMELVYAFPQADTCVTRGPYLQRGSDTEVVIRWRTNNLTNSRVTYGTDPGNLDQIESDATVTIEHEIALSSLSPNTKYFYSVGSSGGELLSGADYFFITAPVTGTRKKSRIWILGDSGTANSDAANVRDAYLNFTDTTHTDLWVMLGDNAYDDGTDIEYEAAVFEMYPTVLRTSVLWPAFGNHDGRSADSNTESGVFYDIFTLPRNAESGGIASGTEAYYSWDFANIHFICLNSHDIDRSTNGPMLNWLQDDLDNNTLDWTVAFWHHPPYTKGSHDSDAESRLIQMRENALPILEAGGVDLVLAGHSHSYERSFLLDGHYDVSGTLTNEMIIDGGDGRADGDSAYSKPTLGPAPHEGTVYITAGSSGKISGGSLDHPAMFISLNQLGSLAMDVDGNQLDLIFLDDSGTQQDYFTIIKGEDAITVANLRLFLQGPYNGGIMNTTLADNSLLPLNQPFNVAPWNYSGTESVGQIPAGVVDWVLLELRTQPDASSKVAARACFIKSDGMIVDLDGSSPVNVDVAADNYYIAVFHRNHLGVMTATAQPLSQNSTLYDFTTSPAQAFGFNATLDLGSGIFGMIAGDGNTDGGVDALDKNFAWRVQNGTPWEYGKYADFNLDGVINQDDHDFLWQPNNGSGVQVPGL